MAVLETTATERIGRRRRGTDDVLVPLVLLAAAALGWAWSVRMTRTEHMTSEPMPGGDMMMAGSNVMVAMSAAAFLLAWLAMMTAMMFPAVIPVVKLYARAAGQGTVAPLPIFVAGYIAVWTAIGIPAYAAWRWLMMPLTEGEAWVGRLAGGVLVAAAVWQLTPLKMVCLRHCRSPLSFFMRFGRRSSRLVGALRMGVTHGAFCLGCCWALMAVLVALGTMNVWWMAGFAGLIFLEKNAPWGEIVARSAAIAFAVGGLVLLVRPSTIMQLT